MPKNPLKTRTFPKAKSSHPFTIVPSAAKSKPNWSGKINNSHTSNTDMTLPHPHFRAKIHVMNSLVRVVAAGLLLPLFSFAQVPKEFEVASIKPSTERPINQVVVGVKIDGSQARISYLSLKDYIGTAFRVRANQILGPDWLASRRFDIVAKIPEGASQADVPEMLQTLLIDRFHMKMRREMREFPVYALKVAATGLKLTESGPGEANANGTVDISAGGNANALGINFGGGSSISMGSGTLEIKKLTMRVIADSLTRFLDRSVVDSTNLKGAYDLTIELTPEDRMSMMIRAALNAGMTLPPQALAMMDNASNGSIFEGLKKAGLTLEPQRAPLEVLVIDQIDKTPTEN
jgi:uncharacterized protein (TIGR03435 family)